MGKKLMAINWNEKNKEIEAIETKFYFVPSFYMYYMPWFKYFRILVGFCICSLPITKHSFSFPGDQCNS